MVKSGQVVVLMINPLNTSVALIWRPVIWFAVEINWLVSIWGQHWRLMGSGKVSCKAFPGKWSLQSFCRLFVVSYKPSPENNLIYLCLVDIFYSLREKCPNAKFFLVHIFSHSDCIQLRENCLNTEFLLVCIFLYSDWIRRFTDWIQTRKNSVFGHFSRNVRNTKSFKTAKHRALLNQVFLTRG